MFIENSELIIHTANYAEVNHTWSRKTFRYPHNILYYITNGSAKLLMEDKTIHLTCGNIYLISGLSFKETICDDILDHYYIHFQAKTSYHDNVIDLYNHPSSISVEAPKLLIDYFDQIIKNSSNNTPYCNLITQGALRLIIAPFFENVITPKKQLLRFIDVLTYIDSHLDQKISIYTLANLMSLETTYFTHLFTQSFSISPKKYIIKKRLERAMIGLSQTDQTIKNIALNLGFSNEMYFSKLFKDKVGISPSDYRRLLLKGD